MSVPLESRAPPRGDRDVIGPRGTTTFGTEGGIQLPGAVRPRAACAAGNRARTVLDSIRRNGQCVAKGGKSAEESCMIKPLRKAVFPVGGLGTRFLPAT